MTLLHLPTTAALSSDSYSCLFSTQFLALLSEMIALLQQMPPLEFAAPAMAAKAHPQPQHQSAHLLTTHRFAAEALQIGPMKQAFQTVMAPLQLLACSVDHFTDSLLASLQPVALFTLKDSQALRVI